MSEGNLIAWPEQFSLFTCRITRDRIEFERTRVSSYGYPVSKWAKMLACCHGNFFSFHCLENESNEPKDSKTEGTENFPDFPEEASQMWNVVLVVSLQRKD